MSDAISPVSSTPRHFTPSIIQPVPMAKADGECQMQPKNLYNIGTKTDFTATSISAIDEAKTTRFRETHEFGHKSRRYARAVHGPYPTSERKERFKRQIGIASTNSTQSAPSIGSNTTSESGAETSVDSTDTANLTQQKLFYSAYVQNLCQKLHSRGIPRTSNFSVLHKPLPDTAPISEHTLFDIRLDIFKRGMTSSSRPLAQQLYNLPVDLTGESSAAPLSNTITVGFGNFCDIQLGPDVGGPEVVFIIQLMPEIHKVAIVNGPPSFDLHGQYRPEAAWSLSVEGTMRGFARSLSLRYLKPGDPVFRAALNPVYWLHWDQKASITIWIYRPGPSVEKPHLLQHFVLTVHPYPRPKRQNVCFDCKAVLLVLSPPADKGKVLNSSHMLCYDCWTKLAQETPVSSVPVSSVP